MEKYRNIAFIPVRGGSKSIPLKNIKCIAGKPLTYWAMKAACKCKYIDKIYVATDSVIIARCINDICNSDNKLFSKVEIVSRSEASSTDEASTEMAMIEFAEKHDFENIVLIQATSPLITEKDLNTGFEKYNKDGIDGVVSVVKQKRFCWGYDNKNNAYAINYDIYRRPRRQDFDGYYVENGAFYITSRDSLLKTGNRISGKIELVLMDEASYFEIDEISDWKIVEHLMESREHKCEMLNWKKIKMVLSDCDGCMTDGGMYYSENGDELKKFNTKDGMGFSILKQSGIITGIITGESVDLVKRRAEKLGVDILKLGCTDKLNSVLKIVQDYGLSLDNVLYIGDDVNDYELMSAVGISCCPNDAIQSIKDIADYVSNKNGGSGVIRDVVSKLMCNR